MTLPRIPIRYRMPALGKLLSGLSLPALIRGFIDGDLPEHVAASVGTPLIRIDGKGFA